GGDPPCPPIAQGWHFRRAGPCRVIMLQDCLDFKFIRISFEGAVRVLMVLCVSSVGGCAAGPDFTRPVPPPATRYTAETLRGEGTAADDQVQHIALGQNIRSEERRGGK